MTDILRRHLLRSGALVAGALSAWTLSGCAALQPGPRTVDISERRLVEAITRQFPRSNRVLDLFDVTLATPKVRLIPAENRIGTLLDFTVGMPLVETRTQRGTLSLSYGLRLEPGDNTVRLTDVRLESLELPDASPSNAARFRRMGGALVEGLLPDLVVHRLKPEDLRTVQGWGYQPGALRVVPGGLELQLDPLPR
ncbi:MAG: hypothetical protein Q8S71_12750 [Hydrogenophaga sp.]|jgi:hypothetical protein|uniref:hypothetical protein n=1 Tax=Hydrogenophaga sp. TaxID=1904254 RepID=UPI002719E8F9|nr:hypothetical protein [Hydrogenophaga sp.]MDO9132854.1 hypothetical protein [Hydrogenophaga sp.]MDP3324402.1 hypothetical protein [Hydrogenophaga sp.]